MRPQTNAEFTLWNYGRRMRDATDRGMTYDAAANHLAAEPGFDDVQRAVVALGYDLSNQWITEGYYAAGTTPSTKA
jgi:hypothetical protein